MRKAAVALLLGCALTAPACAAEVVAVDIAPATSGTVVEGDAVEVVARVTNVSKDSVVVVGAGESRYGALNKALGHEDTLYHETMAQQATPAVFFGFDRVLLPGDSFETKVALDAVDGEVSWSPQLAVHDLATFRPYLPSVVSMTRKVYDRGDANAVRLKRESATRLSRGAADAGNLPESAFEDFHKYGVAIFETGRPEKAVARAKVELAPRAFSLRAARERFGVAAEQARWSHAAAGWVLASPARTAIVRETEVIELPAGSFAVLVDADRAPRSPIVFRLGKTTADALAKIATAHPGDGMYRQGTFVDVPASRVVEALEILQREKAAISRTSLFKSWFYDVNP
jgi:hypothetical protein